MGAPHFSIITVCFNERDKIRLTCESMVAQTFRDFEWIVIDGGSSDGTLEILRTFESSMATLVSEPDEGIYDAMNKGIKLATGRYLLFMNGGDFFAKNDVLEMVAEAPDCDLISGDMVIPDEQRSNHRAPDRLSREYFKMTTLPHQSSFILRNLFLEFGLYDSSYEISADLEFFARLYGATEPTYWRVPIEVAVFDAAGVSSDATTRWKKKAEDHRVRWKYYPEYRRTLKCFRKILRAVIRKVFSRG